MMERSEQLDKLAPALAKAQSEMGGAVKESNNPFFKSKYADLTSVWKACKEALHNNGFSVVQSPVSDDNRIGVATLLLHSSGQFIQDEYTLGVKKKDDPQADGSSITYARRYALAAFVGVCPVDDDAESAMNRVPKQKKQHIPKELDADTAVGVINHVMKLADAVETETGLTDLYKDNKEQIDRLPKGAQADLLAYLGERKAEVKKAA